MLAPIPQTYTQVSGSSHIAWHTAGGSLVYLQWYTNGQSDYEIHEGEGELMGRV